MPETMANWLTETMRPRIRAGEISAMYMGEVIEAAPMPSPPMMRKKTNSVKLRGKAVPKAETRNSTAETSSTRLRPRRSLSMPAKAGPEGAAEQGAGGRPALPTAGSSSKWVCRKPMAPEMTAVS